MLRREDLSNLSLKSDDCEMLGSEDLPRDEEICQQPKKTLNEGELIPPFSSNVNSKTNISSSEYE